MLVQSGFYTKPSPNWTAASVFDLGAQEYFNYGGYSSCDDIIDEFTVTGPAIVIDTTHEISAGLVPSIGARATSMT